MGGYRRVTSSSQETVQCGEELGKVVFPGLVVLLFGDYGVGKTEFIRGVAHGYLGGTVSHQVASPSFSVLHVYEFETRRICHYDFYRIESQETTSLFQDAEEEDVLCIEWAERIAVPRFREFVQVSIRVLTPNQREITIEATEPLLSKIRESTKA